MKCIVLFLLLLPALKIQAGTDPDSLRAAGSAHLKAADHRAALHTFMQGLEEAKQQNDLRSESMFLVDIGYVYQQEGRLELAYEQYEKARALAEKHHFRDLMGNVIRNMAVILIKKGEYEKAEKNLSEAAGIFDDMGDKDELSSTLNTMGTLQFQLRHFGQALLFYKKALPLFEQLEKETKPGDDKVSIALDIAIVLNNIGEVYKEMHQYASAVFYLERSLGIKKKLGLSLHVANTLNAMGEVYQAMKKYPEALLYYNNAYAIRSRKHDEAAIANSANSLAALYSDTRQYREAEKFLLIARQICERDSLRGELLKNYQLSRKVYRQLGGYAQALLFDERYIALYEQMNREEQLKTIHDLNIKYQTEQKDKEFQLLLKQREAGVLITKVILAFSLVIISVILFAYYQKRKSKQQTELMMREMNHRAKNNFQQLSGLLLLYHKQLKDPVAKKAIKETADRVQAMSVVHRKLYLNEEITLARIDVFISELSEELMLSYGYTRHTMRLMLNLEPVSIAADKAVPLSLIVNELLTNAFKYAFDANPDPVLGLSLHRLDKK
ncbi:MAG: tetratricopeptide repeat protein, partial [Bacteroidota bacterium]